MIPDLDPVEKSVVVPLHPVDAFDLFTMGLNDWWPVASHSLSAAGGDTPREVRVEPVEGGHITETLPDGTTARWGTITRWEPGAALGIRWYVGRPEDQATTIAISFTAVDAGTRVDLVHSGFAVLGATATATRDGYMGGWDLVLGQCFVGACERFMARATQPARL